MPRELIFAPEALADIEEAALWLTQPGSGPRAWRRLAAIQDSIERLCEYPCLWPIGQHAGVRELPCEGGYRAIYEIHPDTGRDETAGDILADATRIWTPGTPPVGGNPAGTAYGYAGYRYDAETGPFHAGTRYYDPRLGRFIQPDPASFSPMEWPSSSNRPISPPAAPDHTAVATGHLADHPICMPTPPPLIDDDEANAEARALATAITEADADPRTVPHEEVRAWLLLLAQGEFDAPPPEPH